MMAIFLIIEECLLVLRHAWLCMIRVDDSVHLHVSGLSPAFRQYHSSMHLKQELVSATEVRSRLVLVLFL